MTSAPSVSAPWFLCWRTVPLIYPPTIIHLDAVPDIQPVEVSSTPKSVNSHSRRGEGCLPVLIARYQLC